MPSPIGHLLAGVAVAWTADLIPSRRAWRTAPASASWLERAGGGLMLTCAALAVAPDLDLLFLWHRTATHSLGAVICVGLFAAAITARTSRPVVRVTLMCAGAYATHLVLDWLSADTNPPYGIQALWPLTSRWFISNLDLFRQTSRRFFFTTPIIRLNLLAVAQELAILGPVVWLLWLVRARTLAGLPTQVAGCDRAPQ